MMDSKPPNPFHVAQLDDTVIAGGLSPRRLTADEAINLAAHLVIFAEAIRHSGKAIVTADFSGLVLELADHVGLSK
jgi:hypothetical protein